MEKIRAEIARVTTAPLYRRRVHQIRALVWMVCCAIGQVLSQGSPDAILTWTGKRWLLGIGAVLVPALCMSMKAGEWNAPLPLDNPVEKPVELPLEPPAKP